MSPVARRSVLLYHRYHAASASGAGTVVLLHGLGSCGDDWGLQLAALRPRYAVLVPDLRGQGRSPMPAGWPSIAGMAEDVLLVLDQLTIESAHVVGLSLGGAVALQMAARAPERVRSLVAVNAFARLRRPRGSMGRWASRVWLALTGRMDQLGRLVAAGLFPLAEQEAMRTLAAARLSGNPAMNYVKLLTAVRRFDLRPQLARIRAPTLIVAGEQDATVPIECKLELAENIRGARFVRIPESGHATPLDQPQRFNAVLLGFLDGVERDPRQGPSPRG